MIEAVIFGADGRLRWGGEESLRTPLAPGEWLWADLEGLRPGYRQLLDELGYHTLAVEDTFTLQHQPKLQEFPGCLFAIVRGLDFNLGEGQLETLKLAAFLGRDRLLTVHRAPMRSVAAVRKRLRESPQAPPGGPARLVYLLFDELVDLYFPVVDAIAEEVEELEKEIFARPRSEQLERVLGLRRRLATLRRAMLPHRQVFSHLGNSGTVFVDEHSTLYFRDVYDNVLRLGDAIDAQRDQLTSVKDTYLSAVAQRTNDVMKVLTLFSAVLLPVTFIAGVYGMNFDRIPELHWSYGYFGALGLMAAVAGGMIWWTRRRGFWD